MNLNRRTFLKSSSVIVGSLILQGSKKLTALNLQSKNFREVKNNFGLFNENGGTIAWYVNNDEVVVIDSQFPDSAKNFMTDLKTKTSNKINYLFNTHHHRDHTMGNTVLREFTDKIISQKNCPELQVMQSKGKENEKLVVTADITFAEEIIVKLNNEIIKAKHFGPAHTGGDIVIHFENLNIAHAGDLVFNSAYPYIDNNGGGSVKEWIEALNKVIEYYDKDTKFVFGHADKDENVMGDKNDVVDMRNYLMTLYDYVEKLVKEGKSPDQIAETNIIPGTTERFEKWDGAKKMNLKNTAEQLTAKL